VKGEFPHPANQPREFAELVEYLEKQGYVVKKEKGSKPIYNVTLEGFEYVYDVGEEIHTV